MISLIRRKKELVKVISKADLNDIGFLKNLNQSYVSFSKDGWYVWAQPTEKDNVYSYVSIRPDPVPKEYEGRPHSYFTDFSHIEDLKEHIQKHEDIKKVERMFALPSDNHGWNHYSSESYEYPDG